MTRKQFSLILILLFGILLFLSRGWWLSLLVDNLLFLEQRSDLVQSVEAVVSLLILVLNGISAYMLWLSKTDKDGAQITRLNLLERVTVDHLRGTLGQGGKVNWIDRNATKVRDLRTHGRVIITGRSRLGKTREAIELIRRAVGEDLVCEESVYRIGTAFRFLDSDNLVGVLRSVLVPDMPTLLFVDNLPFHFVGKDLHKLTVLLNGLRECKESFVIAVGRSDQLSSEHRYWLKKEGFHEVSLSDMDPGQTGRLIDGAAGLFKLQIDDLARDEFIKRSRGTPELPLMALRRIRVDGISQINEGIARHYARESIDEAWAETMRYVVERNPLTSYILTSLASFYAAGITPYEPPVLDYAARLWQQGSPMPWLKRSILKSAIEYLSHFDIVVQNSVFSHPDDVVEGVILTRAALDNLAFFFDGFTHFHRRWRCRLARNCVFYSAAMLELALGYQEQLRYDDAVRLYGHAIRLTPHPSLLSMRGIAKGMQGRYGSAIEDYDRAISLDPSNAVAYLSRGLAHYELGDFDSAGQDFNLAIQMASEASIKAIAFAGHGDIRRSYGALEVAIENYTRAHELSPNDATILNKRGNALYDKHDLQEAIRDYTAAIELAHESPYQAILYTDRGNAFHELGNVDLAIQDYDRASQMDQDNILARGGLWLARTSQGEMGSFSRDYNTLIDELYATLKAFSPEEINIFHLEPSGLSSMDIFAKTVVDLFIAIPAMILVAPLMLAISILIKLDSPGPVIFKRQALGHRGKRIEIRRFRTMLHYEQERLALSELEAQLKVEHKLRGDPRVSRVGMLLRRFSLDELPQLFNVVTGSMSLVGPRAIYPWEAEFYGSELGIMLSVKPGLTGLWQLSGRSDASFHERIRLDTHYVRNYSIWLDLQILMRTIPAVLSSRGAY